MQRDTFIQLLNKSSDIICGLNRFGKFIWVNNSGGNYFYFQNNEYSNKIFFDQFHREDQARLKKVFSQIKSNPNQEFDFKAKHLLENGNKALNWLFTWNEDEELLYCLASIKKKAISLEKDDSYQLFFNNSAFPK